MIEDYIPVEQISRESAREKMTARGRGHLASLHLWWARRPLAASRAAIFATFAPPAVGDERQKLPDFFTELCHWTGPVLPDRPAIVAARDVVSTAADGSRPRVLDMFAGGGAIPLEALRLGADAIAVELNPVAHLVQLCTLKFPQQYGRRLREAVEHWGTWVIEETKTELGGLYPDTPVEMAAEEGTLFAHQAAKRVLRPVAYLWTRTIPSPARGFEKGMVPLVRQTWLRKKKGNYVALRPVVDRKALTVRYEVVTSSARDESGAIREWGFDPAGDNVRGATTCPFSGSPVTAQEAKTAGTTGHMRAQLMAIACIEPGQRGKTYLAADAIALDEAAAERMLDDLLKTSSLTVPDEPLPEKLTGGMCSVYGLTRFGDLFSTRQRLVLLALCANVRKANEEIAKQQDPDLAAAVSAYLGLLVGRMADRCSTLCRWNTPDESVATTYARQALPMVWDYCEINPFGGASGDVTTQLENILTVIDHAMETGPGRPAEVIRGRAQKLPISDSTVDAVITDPPYYDNISYADLSDFFYVWHRRALGAVFPSLYATAITPKKAEAVVAPHRHGKDKAAAASFYEEQMRQSFVEAHRVLKPNAPMICVYAHKTTLGWSTLVDSMRKSGFQVTEAWPLDTEMPDRAGQMNTASLATSIFLVARKRTEGGVGAYATDVRPQMVDIVQQRVAELIKAGITGADLVIAAVGAGLRPFTRFDLVELPNGEELTAERFLDEVQKEALDTILAAMFDVDRSGVGQVDKASRFYVLARYQYGPATVDFGEMNVLAQGLGIELAGPGSLSDGKTRLVDVNKSRTTLRNFLARGKSPDLGQPGVDGPAPLIDVLHRLLWLVDNDRAKVNGFLDEAKVDVGRLHLLANGLKGDALSGGRGGGSRTDEQKAIDRLLAQWRRIAEGRAPLLDHATGGAHAS